MSDSKLLSNFDLDYYAGLFRIPLTAVLSKDLFRSQPAKVGNYIVNLEDSELGGSHWTVIMLTKKLALYYDSFGQPPPQEIIRFVKRFNKKIKIIYSIDQLQSTRSVYCGWFCLLFIHWFAIKHQKSTNYRYLLNQHNALFNIEEREANDMILRKLIKGILDKN
jgi:hypothetical protein